MERQSSHCVPSVSQGFSPKQPSQDEILQLSLCTPDCYAELQAEKSKAKKIKCAAMTKEKGWRS
jgi:hypothetical protein